LFAAEMPVAFADFMNVEDEGNLENSGAVTATWESIGDGAQMHFFFKPNHHAPIGFSQCLVDETVETVTASAALIDPLRLVTGFEGGKCFSAVRSSTSDVSKCRWAPTPF
jgi:hypothetical protein